MIDQSLSEAINRAADLEKNGDYKAAAGIYLSVLAKDKRNRNVLVCLGSLYAKTNKLPEAVKFYQKALTMGSDYLTHFNLGCVLYRTGQYKKAVINLEKSRSLRADFYLPPLVIGLSYSKLENRKAAETNFLEVLRLNPGHKIASTALAILYYNDKRFEEAISVIDRIAGDDAGSIALRNIKSEILYRTGKIDESAEEIKSLKRLSNGYTFYDQFISSLPVESFTDKYGTLEDKISSLSGKADTDSHELLSLSLCYLFKGETDKAIDYLFKAKKQMNR